MELGPNQKEWIRRLRSGEIKQAKRFLGLVDGSRCCLGVACEVRGIVGKEIAEGLQFAGSRVDLPIGVCRDLGFFASNGGSRACFMNEIEAWCNSRGKTHRYSLSAMNDDGWTFNEIADIVEALPNAFFTHPA